MFLSRLSALDAVPLLNRVLRLHAIPAVVEFNKGLGSDKHVVGIVEPDLVNFDILINYFYPLSHEICFFCEESLCLNGEFWN